MSGKPIIDSKKTDILLKILMILSVLVTVYSILTKGQALIHSDTATATLLARSQIKYGEFFPRSWVYGNGDVWVLGMNLTTMPFTFLLKNQALARMCGSAVYVIITVLAIFLSTKFYLKSRSWLLNIPFFLLLTFGNYDFTLYQAAYTGSMMWLMLSAWFAFDMLYGSGQRSHIRAGGVAYIILTILLLMGGIRFAGECTIPLLGAMVLSEYLGIKQEDWNPVGSVISIIKKTMFILFPVVIGFIIYKVICASTTVINTVNNRVEFAYSYKECFNSLFKSLRAVYDIFGLFAPTAFLSTYGIRNFFSIIVCTLLVFIIPVLQYRKYRCETAEVRFFLLFALVHNAEMLFLFVFFGKNEPRYLLSSVFLFEIISARYIYEYWFKRHEPDRFLTTVSYAMIILVYIISLTYPDRSWKADVQARKEFCRNITERGLSKGYASYWNSYVNEIYSDLNLELGAVGINRHSISKYYWLVDKNVFIPEEGKDTFLLLDEKETRMYFQTAEELLGSPTDEFTVDCGEKKYYVYVWDYDIVSRFAP